MKKSNEPTAEKRKLETIRIERRFGGFLPVLQFTDGTTENAGLHVSPTTALALAAATRWITNPAYNIEWWVGSESVRQPLPSDRAAQALALIATLDFGDESDKATSKEQMMDYIREEFGL